MGRRFQPISLKDFKAPNADVIGQNFNLLAQALADLDERFVTAIAKANQSTFGDINVDVIHSKHGLEHAKTIKTSFTIKSGWTNIMAEDITLEAGATVTIESGASWYIGY